MNRLKMGEQSESTVPKAMTPALHDGQSDRLMLANHDRSYRQECQHGQAVDDAIE